MNSRSELGKVISFWFDQLPEQPASGQQLWWGKSSRVDNFVTERFGELLNNLDRDDPLGWITEPVESLAVILCFDQFPRHIYRDQANAFAFDHKARQLTKHGLQHHQDQQLCVIRRTFFYMPLMHSEDITDQQLAVELYHSLLADSVGQEREQLAASASSSVRHHDIVARFGRFPHRNAALGRRSTPEEKHFLTQPGSSF